MSQVAQESKTNALIMWVLTIFFSFIPPLVFVLTKKDDAFVQECSKEALNMTITIIIAFIAVMILSIVLAFIPFIGPIIAMILGFALMALGIAYLVFYILAAIAANKGQAYKAPFALRLVK